MVKPVPPEKTVRHIERLTDTTIQIQYGDIIEFGGISYEFNVEYGDWGDQYYLTQCKVSYVENSAYDKQLADYNIRLKEYHVDLEVQKIVKERQSKRLEEVERAQLKRLKEKYEGGQ